MRFRWIIGALVGVALGLAWLWNVRDLAVDTPAPPSVDAIESEAGTRASVASENALTSGEPALETRLATQSASNLPSTPADEATEQAEFRGRVIRKSDSSPLADYRLSIQDEPLRKGGFVIVTTDVEGRFAARVAVGKVHVQFRDGANQAPERERRVIDADEWRVREVELALEPGPTFFLAITPEEIPVSKLSASLDLADHRGIGDAFAIREGKPPWVRFSARQLTDDGSYRLHVRSHDGLWYGEAPVTRGSGIETRLVHVHLDSRARVNGRVVGPDGILLESAEVELEVASGTDAGWAGGVTRGKFGYSFRSSGRAVLTARSFGYVVKSESIDFTLGEAVERTITLEPLPKAGSIRVRVTSDTRRFDTKSYVSIYLPSEGDEEKEVDEQVGRRSLPVEWSGEPGQRIGACEFLELPHGTYRVSVGSAVAHDNEIAVDWEPNFVEASPPIVLDFNVRDSVGRSDLLLRLRDASTGADVLEFDWLVELGRYDHQKGRTESGEPIFYGWPSNRPLHWRVDKAGYEPLIGTEKDFRIEETREGRSTRIAELVLRPGWAEVVHVSERRTGNSIAGARVFVDHELVGITDADGLLRFERASPPLKIYAEYEGWRTWGSQGYPSGSNRASVWHEVEMLERKGNR